MCGACKETRFAPFFEIAFLSGRTVIKCHFYPELKGDALILYEKKTNPLNELHF